MTLWLTTKQAAEYTGYSVKSLTRFCRSGELQHSRSSVRAGYRFQPAWLDTFLTRRVPTTLSPKRASHNRRERQDAARKGTSANFDARLARKKAQAI